MGDSEKAAKKAAKAALKRAKKEAKSPAVSAGPSSPAPADAGSGLSPAERSAAAAERQVALHRYRMWLSLAAVLVAFATFCVTAKPWQWLAPDDTPAEPVPAEPAP